MKFRRKTAPDAAAEASLDSAPDTPAPPAEPAEPRTDGPFDESEVKGDGEERVDLGSLLVRPGPGRELRLQVDESSGTVQSVLMAGPDGAVELQAFAAPRGGDLWSDVRPQIVADIERRGGQVGEREGRFGTELVCQVPVKRPDGSPATQPSRIVGVNGQRWLLRATLLGRAAIEPDGAQEWEDAIAEVVVRRGTEAMPVGEPLRAVLPDNARRVQ